MADFQSMKFDIICMGWTMRSSKPADKRNFCFSKIFTNASLVQIASLSMVIGFV
jgi:hypothetical protein